MSANRYERMEPSRDEHANETPTTMKSNHHGTTENNMPSTIRLMFRSVSLHKSGVFGNRATIASLTQMAT
eukprot:3217317-Pyramimonas_sp.AAC.1